MRLSSRRLNAILQVVLPILVGVALAGAGYWWYVRPSYAAYERASAEVKGLEARLKGVEAIVARGKSLTWPDEAEPMRLFEARVSKDDHVMDVVEALTRALTESAAATDGKLRNLAIATGDDALEKPAPGGRKPEKTEIQLDPRWGLFQYGMRHTPLAITFDSSYGTIVGFLWRIRNLPTLVEIHSLKLTRGLPLMTAEVTLLVFQRGEPIGPAAQQPVQPEAESPLPNRMEPNVNPITPRLGMPGSGRSGGQRP